MDRLLVNPKYQRAWEKNGWASLAGAVAHFLPDYKKRRKVTVRRVSFPSGRATIDAYFKLYHHRPGGWRYWMRTSKARREFENYAAFEKLGVPAAEPIVCGEERDGLGRLRRAFIITRTVPEACGLDEFFRSKPPWKERWQIIGTLSDILRRLHAAHFYYHDLVWRNILVSREAAAGGRVFLIDCPRGGPARSANERGRLRDLASLDKSAVQFCSRAERLRFLLRYCGKRRLDKETRALAAASIRYRRKRWPGDWRGQ